MASISVTNTRERNYSGTWTVSPSEDATEACSTIQMAQFTQAEDQ